MPWSFFFCWPGAVRMVWPLGFKYTHGFKEKYWAVGITFAIMGLSLWLMSLSTSAKDGAVPVGTAYAVWTGIGAAGTAVLGMLIFGEPRDWVRLVCLSLIIAGAIGLKLFSPPASIVNQAKGADQPPAALGENL